MNTATQCWQVFQPAALAICSPFGTLPYNWSRHRPRDATTQRAVLTQDMTAHRTQIGGACLPLPERLGPIVPFQRSSSCRRYGVSPAPSFVVDEQARCPLDASFHRWRSRLPRCCSPYLERSAGQCHIGTVGSVFSVGALKTKLFARSHLQLSHHRPVSFI